METIAKTERRLAKAKAKREAKELEQLAARQARAEESARRLAKARVEAAERQKQESEELWVVAGTRRKARPERRMRRKHQQWLGEGLDRQDVQAAVPGGTLAAARERKGRRWNAEEQCGEKTSRKESVTNSFHILMQGDGGQREQNFFLGNSTRLPQQRGTILSNMASSPDAAASDIKDADHTDFQDCSSAVAGAVWGAREDHAFPCAQAQQRGSGTVTPEIYFDCLGFDCLDLTPEHSAPSALLTPPMTTARAAAGLLTELLWKRLLPHCWLLGPPLARWTWSMLLEFHEPHTWLRGCMWLWNRSRPARRYVARTTAGLVMELLWERLLLHCLLLGLPLACWTCSAIFQAHEPCTWLAGSSFTDDVANELLAGVGASGWVLGHDTAWLLLTAAALGSALRPLRPLAMAAMSVGTAARGLARRARQRLATLTADEESSCPTWLWGRRVIYLHAQDQAQARDGGAQDWRGRLARLVGRNVAYGPTRAHSQTRGRAQTGRAQTGMADGAIVEVRRLRVVSGTGIIHEGYGWHARVRLRQPTPPRRRYN